MILNRGFRGSLEREKLQKENTNLLESFAKVSVNFFQGYTDSSTIVGFLIPLALPILLIILFIASMIVFIIYIFPGYFETRKEYVKVWKQRLILFCTIFTFLGMIFCFVLITTNMQSSINEAKYTQCFYFMI